MTGAERMGRANQKSRTRKDLLQAASRLIKQGRSPTLDEVAEEALVSRATAYRYFPSIEALLVEASVDVAVPDAEEILRDEASNDPVVRLQRVETALYDMILANEPLLRTLLAHTIGRDNQADGTDKLLPRRQDRRTPLIEAALEPARDQFKPGATPQIIWISFVVSAEGATQLLSYVTRRPTALNRAFSALFQNTPISWGVAPGYG